MQLRRKLQLVLGGLGGVMLLTGFVAGLTLWELREALPSSPDALPRTDRLLTRGLWIVGGATAVGLLGVALGTRWVLGALRRSLRVLWTAVEHVQAGRLEQRVTVEVEDEIGRAARALNRMTQTLSENTVSRSYLRAILDSMAELLFVVGDDGRIRRANRAALDALGLSQATLRGAPLARYFDADPLPSGTAAPPGPNSGAAPAASPTADATEDRVVERRLLPPEAAPRPVLVSRATLRGAGDGEGTFVCVAQDISARKEAERRLQRSLEEKSVLLREVQHRVKNNLQVILSLLHVQAQAVEDPDARQRFEDSVRRVRSIAAIHEQLYASSDVSRVAFGTYLDRLTSRLLDAHHSRAVSVRVDADDDATLPVTLAIPAGLIVNELVTNALEHAFPEGRAGTIAVQFHTDASRATLVVEDDGTGTNASVFASDPSGGSPDRSPPGGRPPNRVSPDDSSLGLRLVRGLVRQLRGSMDVSTAPGVRVVVSFPIDAGDSSPSPPEPVSE